MEISPISEILEQILKQKPSDKTAKLKNLFRLLADIINVLPSIAYKVLVILGQKYEEAEEDEERSTKANYFPQAYKTLCTTYRNLKFEQALKQDLKGCWEAEPIMLGNLCQYIYTWFENDMQSQSDLLKIFVSALDPNQLQEIIWDVASGKYTVTDPAYLTNLLSVLS